MRRARLTAVALAVVLSATACTGSDPEPGPTTTGAQPTSSAPADDGSVVVEVEHLGAPVELTVHPVQVVGEHALLTVDYTMGDDAPAGTNLSIAALLRNAGSFLNVGKLRLVDPEGMRAWEVGRDGGTSVSTSGDALNLAPGGSVTSEAFFAAPDATSVDVLFPYFGLVEDVPVVTGQDVGTTPEDLGATATAVYPEGGVEVFSVAYDGAASTQVQAEDATVTLASDVLFATDVSDLTPEAGAAVDAAAAQIAAAAQEGEVVVTGHTDDVGSDDYNLALSDRRAASVAARLGQTLGGGFTLRTEGKGETEPVASGTSPEARAANRRVEVRFTVAQAGQALEVTTGDVAVPEPTGAVGTAGSPVQVDVAGATWAVSATEVRRSGPFLVGSLEIERVSSGTGAPVGLFGDFAEGRLLSRGLSSTTLTAGAYGATLLGEGSYLYPADYLRGDADGDDARGVLADQFVDAPLSQGESVTVTVLWPDSGQDSVTVDAQGRFRITDVPVEG
ncbi:OmpA family protein [Cellulomonas iranensis]|uniref:Outer membrane protein OmpA-like peptidoglycan-associated protein n=1 Tax=Cellulomonas iranensis TaxID=76862 RepID=A0ABU0GLT0_9CELL|nr:OmpA family protein [Cellulomonas iranensis]MDQ0426319.1 outer membrane protein OmpA-like peptidoglycan-associated protein [Cellulomonas iranensis]